MILPKVATPGQRWRRRYGLPAFGGGVVLLWVLLAIAAPWITPYDPNFVEVGARLLPPSATHWLGTDTLGRDVLTRVIYGARVSLSVGFAVVLLGGCSARWSAPSPPMPAAGRRKR